MFYVAGVLENVSTKRFHPIVFIPAPMPGGADETLSAQRYKSKGHHTVGFDTLNEAQAHITAQAEWRDSGLVWGWDGVDTPAMVEWFSFAEAA
jgi:hypothetical protein